MPAEIHQVRDPLTESNCYIVAEGTHCCVIDPNSAELVPEELRKRKLQPDWIFLTHEHCDHIAGLNALREEYPEARLCVSEACNEGIQDQRRNLSSIMEIYLAFRGRPRVSYAPFICRPAETCFSGTHEVLWREHSFRMIPLPGHAPGGTGIWLDQDCFFSGDYLLPGEEVILRFRGGDEAAYLETTKPVLDGLPDGIRIFPGHGDSYLLDRI